MEFFRRAAGSPARLGIFPASFHPVTRAHLGLGRDALARVEEVLFVLPRRFPHKEYETVGFKDRLRILLAAIAGEPRFSVAATDGGLFIDIARECRPFYPPGTEFWFLCGRDAADRIVNWDYGEAGAFEKQLREFGLLVADRGGRYDPPERFRNRIVRLETSADYAGISATEVRRRIARGDRWEHLVPPPAVELIREIYRKRIPRDPPGGVV